MRCFQARNYLKTKLKITTKMKIWDRVRLSETGSSNPADQGFYVWSERVLLLALISDAIVSANGLEFVSKPSNLQMI